MKRNAILHGISAVCSVLVYAFFALPFFTIKMMGESKSTNGYDFLEAALKSSGGSSLATFTVVISIITLVLAGVVCLASVFALLNDFNVFKNAKMEKIANWVAFGCAAVLAVSCIMLLIANASFVAEDIAKPYKAMEAMGMSVKVTAGWALTIITTVLGLGATATNIVPAIKK